MSSSTNMDRALDDIIGDSGRSDGRSGGGHRHSRNTSQRIRNQGHSDSKSNSNSSSRRDSPYGRNRDSGSSQQSQRRGKWTHDLFDGPGGINGRLGPSNSRLGPSNDRLGLSNDISDRLGTKKAGTPPNKSKSSGRGLAIAGRSRDTTAHDAFRVIYATGIPHNFTSEQLERVFSDVGRVDSVRMGIDKNDRFIGKAEITYRQPEDARSAMQVFDGETLYGTDIKFHEKIAVRFSTPWDAEYLDELKFVSSLPQPREVPVMDRLGGVASRAIASAGMFAMQQFEAYDDGSSAWFNNGGAKNYSGGNNHGNGRGHTGRQAQTTAQQLDDDLDAYMNESNERSAGGKPTEPDAATAKSAEADASMADE
ncbi:hypothetical protein GGF37_004599 [Kickxella alabastrina]|nr:hypothetical protein GGF37_004599 [Kickxella alabastrina]